MKRYQNPDVFEPLAMAYALGTLQGRARARFEKLMARHFYLRVVTEAYEHQFAGLAELLPAQEPPPEVWQRLEQELGLKTSVQTSASPAVKAKEKKPTGRFLAWFDWLHVPAMAIASVLAAVITVLVMNNLSPETYLANLQSTTRPGFAIAAASKEDMKITIALAEKLDVKQGLTPTLWCLSKNPGEKPIRMGTLNATGESQVSIKSWGNLEHISKLAISLEAVDDTEAGKPMGEVIYEGKLVRGE